MNDFDSIPLDLQKIIYYFKIVEVIEGRLGDKIIKLSNKNNEFLYLKISYTKITQNEMFNEFEMLNWLSSHKLNVPKVIFFKNEMYKSYMLLSNVPGISAHKISDQFSKDEIIKVSAEALQKIHKIDVCSIPLGYRNCLDSELKRIYADVYSNMIDVEAFKKANYDKTPQVVLEYLQDKRSIFNTDVFTHGDYCLPNILIVDQYNYGFVDWSQAGIGDIYRDLSPIVKSITRNFGEMYSTVFLKYYGIDKDEVNIEKIVYYDLIDQFTYFKK
jgi:aminoglycoside phosphotransferase